MCTAYICTCLVPVLLLALIQCQLFVQVALVGQLLLRKGANAFKVPFQHAKFLLVDRRNDCIRRRAKSEMDICGHVAGTDVRRTGCPLKKTQIRNNTRILSRNINSPLHPHPGLLTQQAPHRAHYDFPWAPALGFADWHHCILEPVQEAPSVCYP